MAKRIGILIFSIAITVTGTIAFNRLHYWEQSVRIFNVDYEQTFRRGGDRNRGGSDRNERYNRPERRNSQNLRNSNDENRGSRFDEEQALVLSDSLNQTENTPTNRSTFRDRDYRRGGHDRSGSRRSSSIRLENAGWFLAVFAMVTVVTIYIDTLLKRFRSGFFRKKTGLFS